MTEQKDNFDLADYRWMTFLPKDTDDEIIAQFTRKYGHPPQHIIRRKVLAYAGPEPPGGPLPNRHTI